MSRPGALPRLRPPMLGRSRLILVDGPSGAGKTTYVQELAAALGPGAEVVHTDDLLDGWDDQFTYWERLERQVLAPLRHGEPGRYQRYDWHAKAFSPEWVTVRPAEVVIVEGVGAGRSQGRFWASLTVFVQAPPEVCRARTLARDGAAVDPYLRIWRLREAEHFAADATARHADLIVEGDESQDDPDRGIDDGRAA